MTQLNKLKKITKSKKKRRGRGYGSGKGGHTSGRGAKGFKARNKVGVLFEGTKTKKSFYKKLPLKRGKGKQKSLRPGPLVVNVRFLNLFAKNAKVTEENLVKQKVVTAADARKQGIKILGGGQLKVPLQVFLPCSQGAAKKIKKAGGKIIEK